MRDPKTGKFVKGSKPVVKTKANTGKVKEAVSSAKKAENKHKVFRNEFRGNDVKNNSNFE